MSYLLANLPRYSARMPGGGATPGSEYPTKFGPSVYHVFTRRKESNLAVLRCLLHSRVHLMCKVKLRASVHKILVNSPVRVESM